MTSKESDSSSSSTTARLEAAIDAMTDASDPKLFDVTIICSTDDLQAAYWTERLSAGVCRSVPGKEGLSPEAKKARTNGSGGVGKFPMALAVSEDWSAGGAGNGLGTLYAFQKACGVAKETHNVDLKALLADKTISAAVYHTAGKGTRLAPLPASENNNKPAVKLPACHTLANGDVVPLTVLEAVVKQTGVYAASRKGRLSVYWGDQVFVPSAPFDREPTHHVDIMCTLLGEDAAMPSAEEWAEKGLDRYGVVAVSASPGKEAAQVEKVDHATATKMLASLGNVGAVGPSLGSFSVSAAMLEALATEFSKELDAKTGKFDTDPHFWMPLTLAEDDYASLMAQKGVDDAESRAHHSRITKMRESFDKGDDLGLFGAVDVGKDACWWDYGQLKYYYDNNAKILANDDDARLLRRFLGVSEDSKTEQCRLPNDNGLVVDDVSRLSNCRVAEGGSVAKSVLCSVTARTVEADEAIVVACAARRIVAGKGAVVYNVRDDSEEGVVVPDGGVLVGVEGGVLKSRRDLCGGKVWKTIVEGNDASFEDVHKRNQNADVGAIENKRKEETAKLVASLGM